MKSSAIPDRIGTPFASSGTKNDIAETSSTSTLAAGTATYDVGFPPLTMTAISSGGVPPSGADMNGLLYDITYKQQWADAGMGSPFDSTFSTAIGGYPAGAYVPSSDFRGYWLNINEANATSPEGASGSSTGWVPGYVYGSATQAISTSNVTLSDIKAAKRRIILTGALTGNRTLFLPPWIMDWDIENNCTGTSYYVVLSTTSAGATITSRPGTVTRIHCDGTNITSPLSSRGTIVFTSSGTFTVPSNVTRLKVTVVGGGGAGGGCQGSSTTETISGAGGGAGGTAISWLTVTPGQSYAITVGAGGTAVSGAISAGNGGQSSFGASIIAHGGIGGGYASATSTAGGNGGEATGGDININGGYGSDGQTGSFIFAGNGGASSLGGGGRAGARQGYIGQAYGSGGGGAFDSAMSGTKYTGGTGKSGVVIIEY